MNAKEFFDKLKDGKNKPSCFIIGNGFNKYMFGSSGSKENDIYDWKNVIKSVAERVKLPNFHLDALFGHGISNLEWIDLLENFASQNSGIDLSSIIKDAVKELERKDFSKNCAILKYAWDNNHHIFTTNFDHNIESYIKAQYPGDILSDQRLVLPGHSNHSIYNKSNKKSNGTSEAPRTERVRYHWNDFWGEPLKEAFCENDDIISKDLKHDVWHIHGSYFSLRNRREEDASGILFSLRKYLQAVKHVGTFDEINSNDYWKGRNTWMSLFMRLPLVIAGFGYSKDEFFLRHLLLKKDLLQKNGDGKIMQSSFYLRVKWQTAKTDDGSDFLAYLGFNIVDFESYDELYNHAQWQ
ncbi:MAG: hypothetical protein MJ202_02475 [Lentisphaeria bacterium]|nr:hypothetical protein [Lentisphaeria bacterium]